MLWNCFKLYIAVITAFDIQLRFAYILTRLCTLVEIMTLVYQPTYMTATFLVVESWRELFPAYIAVYRLELFCKWFAFEPLVTNSRTPDAPLNTFALKFSIATATFYKVYFVLIHSGVVIALCLSP